MQDIEVAIRRLQADIHRLKVGLALLVAMITVAAAFANGGQKGQVVTAERFVLQDKTGRTLAELGPGANEQPKLELYASDAPSVYPGGPPSPVIALWVGSDGKPTLSLGSDPREGVTLRVTSGGGLVQTNGGGGLASLNVSDIGPFVDLHRGQERATLFVGDSGASLSLVEGKASASINSHPRVYLTDPAGQVRAAIALGKGGDPFMRFDDVFAKAGLIIGFDECEAPFFGLRGSDGKIKTGFLIDGNDQLGKAFFCDLDGNCVPLFRHVEGRPRRVTLGTGC